MDFDFWSRLSSLNPFAVAIAAPHLRASLPKIGKLPCYHRVLFIYFGTLSRVRYLRPCGCTETRREAHGAKRQDARNKAPMERSHHPSS
jgi:hypothetical protein